MPDNFDDNHVFNILHYQNKQLEKMSNSNSIQRNNINYINTELYNIMYWNNILFYVFIAIGIILIVFLYFKGKTSLYLLVFYTLAIFLFPFIALYIESAIYYFGSYLLAMVKSTPFTPPNNTYFSGLISANR